MGVLKGKTAIKLFKSYPKAERRPYWRIQEQGTLRQHYSDGREQDTALRVKYQEYKKKERTRPTRESDPFRCLVDYDDIQRSLQKAATIAST